VHQHGNPEVNSTVAVGQGYKDILRLIGATLIDEFAQAQIEQWPKLWEYIADEVYVKDNVNEVC
jgi:hypothetical protein